MTDSRYELIANALVDQHYASGPEEMKKAVSEALGAAAAGQLEATGNPRERLKKEVDQAIAASARGSE